MRALTLLLALAALALAAWALRDALRAEALAQQCEEDTLLLQSRIDHTDLELSVFRAEVRLRAVRP